MKKTLSLILALLMSASCAATIFADEDVEAISAITEDAPAAEEEVVEAETEYDLAIEFLEAKKILQGKGDGLLHAEDAVKRYEMAILGARVATGWVNNDQWMNGPADNTKFNDLEGSGAKNALGALSYANQNGIVVGYPDGSFKPENTVTYRDALAIAVRTLGYTGLEYPWGIIEKAVTLGLTDDITGVAYTDEINRGVAAQIIYNALFAKTAGNKTLAMESFGCEYGWQTIVVVADDKVAYEVGIKDTKDASGIVAFKLVNNDGTFGAETFNVKADLAFGGFYNALFEIDKDAELVDLVKAIEIAPETISNRGNDLETADAIGDFLKNYELVEKYNVKNLSKTTLYDDELILKGEEEKTIITGYDAAAAYIVAFDWDSGDIVKLDKDGKYVETLWNYNEDFGYYFRLEELDKDADKDAPKHFGIDIMDEKDVADLKAYIKDATAKKFTDAGYGDIDKPAYHQYADLTVWNLNNDDLADYAIWEKYSFGTLAYGDKDCCCDNSTAHKVKLIKLGGDDYVEEGTCAHHSVKGGHYTETYTWAEGFEPSEGYTGYVIYGVDNVKNELKVVKEIAELGKNADEDSYVSYGIVRGFNAADKKVTIGDATFSWDISGLAGVDAASAKYYDSLFNQFVKFVLVDGKLAHIEVSGKGGDNYIVVERYLGIDNDGYIVIQGYTTNDRVLAEFRIGAYDGWKQGSAFFYPEESKIAEKFVKGNVYKITSTDTTEANGKVYYVTALAIVDRDGQFEDYENGELVIREIKTDAPEVTFKFEEGYREKTIGTTTTMKKMSADDVYVIVGEYKADYNFKPIYFYKGIVPDGWEVTGNLIVGQDHLFVFVNAYDIEGFTKDTHKTSFIATLDGAEYVKVGFDGYMSDYYYYGATTYKVKAFDLIQAKTVDSITGYNLDLEDEAIYVTIDGAIVDDAAAYTWEGFKTAMNDAYADQNAADGLGYVTFTYTLTAKNATKEAVSKYMSTKKEGFGFKNEHDDLVDEVIIKAVVVGDEGKGNLEDVVSLADAKIDLDDIVSVDAYAIYRANDKKVVLYVEPWKIDNKPVVDATTTVPSTTVAVVAGQDDEAYIEAVAGITTTTDDGVKSYTLDSITFNWTGKATADRHNAIDLDNFHFGDAGLCTIENWMAKVDVKKFDATYDKTAKWAVTPYENDGSIVAATYADHDEDTTGCDLVKKVTFKLATPVALKADEWQMVQVVFFANEADPATKTGYVFTACATVKNGAVYFAIDNENGINRVGGAAVEIIERANMDK